MSATWTAQERPRASVGQGEECPEPKNGVYTTCQPEHGVPDCNSARQAKMAVDSRAFPIFIYDPRKGEKIRERLSLVGNPSQKEDWWTPSNPLPSLISRGQRGDSPSNSTATGILRQYFCKPRKSGCGTGIRFKSWQGCSKDKQRCRGASWRNSTRILCR